MICSATPVSRGFDSDFPTPFCFVRMSTDKPARWCLTFPRMAGLSATSVSAPAPAEECRHVQTGPSKDRRRVRDRRGCDDVTGRPGTIAPDPEEASGARGTTVGSREGDTELETHLSEFGWPSAGAAAPH